MTRTGARACSPGSRARPAVLAPRHGNRALDAAERLLERDWHLDMQIGAALLGRRAPAALGQDFRKQIAECRRVIGPTSRKIESLEPRGLSPRRLCRAVAGVVARTSRWINQRFVRLENLSESLLGRLIARVDVRVKPPRKTTVSPLDLGLRRSLLHAENDIQIHLRIFDVGSPITNALLVVHDLGVDDVPLRTL